MRLAIRDSNGAVSGQANLKVGERDVLIFDISDPEIYMQMQKVGLAKVVKQIEGDIKNNRVFLLPPGISVKVLSVEG